METPKLWSVCWIHVKADHVKQGRPSPNVLPSEEKSVCKWGRYVAENKNERHLKRAGRVDEKHLFPTLWFLGADHGRQDPFSAKEFWQIPLRLWVTCPFFLAGSEMIPISIDPDRRWILYMRCALIIMWVNNMITICHKVKKKNLVTKCFYENNQLIEPF